MSEQGRRHQVVFGEGRISETHLPQKFSFSSDFGHFILEMLENAKFEYASRNKILKYHNFWGSPR